MCTCAGCAAALPGSATPGRKRRWGCLQGVSQQRSWDVAGWSAVRRARTPACNMLLLHHSALPANGRSRDMPGSVLTQAHGHARVVLDLGQRVVEALQQEERAGQSRTR